MSDNCAASNRAAGSPAKHGALRIVLQYLLFGALWIFFSDELLGILVSDRHLITRISVFKGWLFIAITSLLLLFLIRRMLHDIQQTQQKLEISEERYQTIFNSVNDAIFIHDPATGAILDVNRRMIEMYGYNREDALRLKVEQISSGIPPYTQQEAREWMHKAASGTPQLFTWQARHRSGRLFWGEVNMRLDRILDQERVIVTVRDITERKLVEERLQLQTVQLAEEIVERQMAQETLQDQTVVLEEEIEDRKRSDLALQESERRLRALFEGAPIGMFRTTLDGQLLQVNAAQANMFGYGTAEEMIAQVNPAGAAVTLWLTPEAHQATIEKAIAAKGEYIQQELSLLCKDGKLLDAIFYMMLTSDPGSDKPCLVGFIQDITGRKRLEEQLHQSQKMESIGRLAGGVAHDFNNMLSVILGSVELLQRKLPEDHPGFKYLEQIGKAAKRSSDITRQLLAFSRKEIIAPRPVNLNSLIIDSEKMLARLISEDIKLTFHPATSLWTVKIDPSQVDQILMNLAVNARDAMPDGGSLMIETANLSIEREFGQSYPEARPGEFVQLSISDTGHGMEREICDHIFEPFFTTKEVGQGTGLGLATVYGIVTQNSGFINVYSEPGQGTVFRIYLPRLIEEVTPTEQHIPPAPTGSGTILLVEDEEMLLQVATNQLEEIGYRVIQAASPQAAIDIVSRGDQVIDLILTDVVMPGMNGKEMADRIKSIRPEIKVLFMSGYTADIVAQRGIIEQGMQFIQKPLVAAQLNDKISEILRSAP